MEVIQQQPLVTRASSTRTTRHRVRHESKAEPEASWDDVVFAPLDIHEQRSWSLYQGGNQVVQFCKVSELDRKEFKPVSSPLRFYR